jgi:hypothetical protein
MTVKQFKESVCNNAAGVIDCTGLRVHVQSGTSWSDIEPVACLDSGGNLATGTGADTDALSTLTGGASAVVLVTVCYEWDLVADVPLLDALGNMQSGGTLVQVATTFRTEPY